MLYVIPCSLAESLSMGWCVPPCRCSVQQLSDGASRDNRFHQAFQDLGKPPHVYLAINAEDSNIVYYKLSPGIVKPPV